jgi:hypothetical protein
MKALLGALPCFQQEQPVSQSYLTASVDTGSQVSAALPTETQQISSKQKFRNRKDLSFKYEYKKSYIFIRVFILVYLRII